MYGTIVYLKKCLFNESKFKTKEVKYNVYLLINLTIVKYGNDEVQTNTIHFSGIDHVCCTGQKNEAGVRDWIWQGRSDPGRDF